MKPFFFVGSKRSGTTWLARMINLHPQIHCTLESDVVWILYCLKHGLPLKSHPEDNSAGMNGTLKAAGKLIEEWSHAGCPDPEEAYFRIQRHLIRKGYRNIPARPNCKAKVIGDKKPRQTADPRCLEFIREHFTDQKWIHLIRHPQAVVSSMKRLTRRRKLKVDCWKGSANQVLRRWVETEERVLELKRECSVLTVRYEDLVRNPVRQMRRLQAFLKVKDYPGLHRRWRQLKLPNQNRKYKSKKLDLSNPRTVRILEHYGYSLFSVR